MARGAVKYLHGPKEKIPQILAEGKADADDIIVLDHGLKVEEGTHEELLRANGVYANIYRAQISSIE